MDETLGWCRGCGRSDEDIAEWHSAEDSRRAAIWALLPKRVEVLGISITRLPWQYGRVGEVVAESLRQKSGTWILGCHGAVAEFSCGHGETCDVSITGDTITAISDGGALRLTIDEHVRALQLRPGQTRCGYRAILLVVLKARASLPVVTTLTSLGRDEAAVRPECRNEQLFDLGLGRADLRFCIRTPESELRDKLNQASGQSLPDLLQAAGPVILRHSPARVVESPIGRAEVFTPIPPLGGQSPDGSHTHLFPDQLASGRSSLPGIDLPPVYALGAIFYPRVGSQPGSELGCSPASGAMAESPHG
jgi:hypothetical protein